MSESGMRQSLVSRLSKLDAQSIEVPIKTGVPDINYKSGWIECKFKEGWPKNADTAPVRFKHPVTVGQKVWMRRRVRKGGRCIVAAKIGMEWFFWDVARFDLDRFDNMTRPEMLESCHLHFKYRIDDDMLFHFLETPLC
jgi:hypothetical protein